MKRGLLLTAVVGLAAGSASGHAASPSRIVFSADRPSAVSGVVYRVAPDGHRAVLAHGWWLDARPTVSPDGKTVAFFSQLKGTVTVDEIGIDGHGLVRVGPMLSEQGQYPYLAWQPQGNRLALTGGSGDFWILRRGHEPVEVVQGRDALQPGWSPDGRVVTVRMLGSVDAFTPDGRRLWAIGGGKAAAWSRQGLVAAVTPKGVGVYSEQGSVRFRDAGPVTGGPAWSADGKLAVIVDHRLDVETSAGEILLKRSIPGDRGHGIVWDGDQRVILGAFGAGCGAKSFDVRTGKVSSASCRWFDPLSANAKLAIVTGRSGSGYALQAVPTRGGAGTTYAHVPLGYSDGPIPAVESAQFAGPTRTLVYASYDPEPFQNLYSIAPDGSGIHRLAAPPYAMQPALSADGSRIAYAWAPNTGLTCKGCASQIRVANADGSGATVLTRPPYCTFDSNPTWSPDGTAILYSEDACDSPGELFTIPAGGGTPHDLGIAGMQPAWGPSRIAYVGSDQAHAGLWTANPDGSDPVEVAADGSDPAWSPDGRLAYLEGPAGTTVVVGSASVTLPFADVTSLAWSPDGSEFVVTARKSRYAWPDVYTVKTDGTDPVRLTTNYDASGASW